MNTRPKIQNVTPGFVFWRMSRNFPTPVICLDFIHRRKQQNKDYLQTQTSEPYCGGISPFNTILIAFHDWQSTTCHWYVHHSLLFFLFVAIIQLPYSTFLTLLFFISVVRNPNECEWNERRFPHNYTFHPTVGIFGISYCIKCICNVRFIGTIKL